VRFASFLSGAFIPAIVVNPPERKLAITPLCSDLNDQNLFHSTIDTPPGVPGVWKNPDDQTEIHSGDLER
jgi:hypothetical protein